MKRRTAKDWDKIIHDFIESGLTQKEYCNKNNLNYYSLRDQRIKRESDVPKKKLIRLTPEKSIHPVMEPVVNSNTEVIKISFPSGVLLEIPVAVNEKTAKVFITTLWSLK
ncbi:MULTISPECIES: hypothetical protein [unclassified Oceanispirochaeta]|uniref:IS66 family insertion sequence element accessory protein TnpA n=1 Tax=unclassified Oceanispirochaeta TaxID=2635722 RepID=UPI000E09AC50|nr:MULTISPECIES: hypothetical protein [unclassified Oceanispirochaeta]MBF9018978.1 hypothetical protein [Oceanispirochaeta sp. M2]NPD75478.1 hypothetical protein [Oceanispirochaeta sp. M1]RDG28670.1 hypothetical protein DV872_25620 [Oceanispirochaeta sp. M1]